ncbi:MAG: hypothetical protein ACJ74T_02880 [Pyrinomonadaceae bacterium]
MKKLRALVIIVPLLLLMAEENAQALPLSGMTRDQFESRPAKGELDPLAANKTNSALTLSKGEAAGGKKSAAAAHQRRHGRRRGHRKSKRYSDAARARKNLDSIKGDYRRRTHKGLVVTSFVRTEAQQASAIRGLLSRHKVRYVRRLYRNGVTIDEILAAYLENRRNPQEAQHAMTKVISDQVARGVYVSKHLRGFAADIRRHGKGAARLSALRAAAHTVGATVLVEPECYHLDLI